MIAAALLAGSLLAAPASTTTTLRRASPVVELHLRGTMHRVPIEGSLILHPDSQTWEASFWHDQAAQHTVQLYIGGIRGDYLHTDEGDEFRTTSYQSDAVIVLREIAPQRYRVLRTNVDMQLDYIGP